MYIKRSLEPFWHALSALGETGGIEDLLGE